MTAPLAAALASAAFVALASPSPAVETFVNPAGQYRALGVSYKDSKDLGPEFTQNLSRVFDLGQWFGCLYMGSVIKCMDGLGDKVPCAKFDAYVAKMSAAMTAEMNDAKGMPAQSPKLRAGLVGLRDQTLAALRRTVQCTTRAGTVDVKALKERLLAVQGSMCVALAAPQGVTGTLPPVAPLKIPAATKPVAPKPGQPGVKAVLPAATKPVAPKPGQPGVKAVQGPTPLPTAQDTAALLATRQAALAKLAVNTLPHAKMLALVESSKAALAVERAKAAEAKAGLAKNAAAKAKAPAVLAAANQKFDAVVKAVGDARREAAVAAVSARAAQVAAALPLAQRLARDAAAARAKAEAAAQRALK